MNDPRSSIIECVRENAVKYGSKVAVLDAATRLTYAELWSRVQSFAAYLKDKCDIKSGDIIVARTAQEVWYPVVYFGIHLAGGVTLGLEKNVSDDTVKEICELTECKVLVSNKPENPEVSREDLHYIDSRRIMETTDINFEHEFALPDGNAVADIMFTTGTTGASKGVCIAHQSLVNNAAKLIKGFGFKADTVIIVPGPLNHGGALRKLHATVLNGSTIYILNGMLSIKDFYTALDCGLGSIACCLPPSAVKMLLMLSGKRVADYADIIDFIESASAPLPETDRITLGNALPNTRIIIQYGSTECGGLTVYDCNHERGLIDCVGYPMPGSEVFIVDDDGKFISSDKRHIGIIASKGNAQMECYYKAPELTSAIMRDGLVYTSDMGYFDEEGRLYITGRKDDVINVGGLKVAPVEVESVALQYPGVIDCICIASKDNLLGFVPTMLIVLEQNVSFDCNNLMDYLSTHLEAYKVPRSIKKVDTIKRLYNGKIDRNSYRVITENE